MARIVQGVELGGRRRAARINQKVLAKRLGISWHALSDIENGRIVIGAETSTAIRSAIEQGTPRSKNGKR